MGWVFRYPSKGCENSPQAREGKLINSSNQSDHGMVMDFADIKYIAKTEIHDKLDHGFIVWEKDDELIDFFSHSDGHKMIKVPFTSTAENVAQYIFDIFSKELTTKFDTGLKLSSVKLWETPTSYALCENESC